MPIYLYQNGYSVPAIFGYYALFYFFGMFFDVAVGYLVAYVGPKHVMRISFLLSTGFALLLTFITKIPYAIVPIAFLGALASTCYFLPYNIDFSKIKHKRHGGKEVSFLQVAEKTAAVLAPVIGGLLATIARPELTFFIAALAMLIASVVLMLSPEPVRTRQKITFSGLSPKKHLREYGAFAFFCAENAVSMLVWPLFLALAVFSGEVYLKLGLVATISVLIAIFVAVPLGKMLDNKKGHAMITYGTTINSVIHLLRIGVSSLFGAALISLANEPDTLVYRIAFLKGYYDRADDYPGQRIAFIIMNEVSADIVRTVTFAALGLLSLHFSVYATCVVAFVLGALYSQLIRLERYPALKA